MLEKTGPPRLFNVNRHAQVRLWSILAGAALVILDLIWMVAWYQILLKPPVGQTLVTLTITAIFILSSLLAQALNTARILKNHRIVLFIIWLFLVVAGSLRVLVFRDFESSTYGVVVRLVREVVAGELTGFWHVLIIQLIALRAVMLAQKTVDTSVLGDSMRLGLLLLLVLGLVIPPPAMPVMLLLLLAYLFIGLFGMSLARIASLGESGQARLPALGARWGMGILLAAGLVVGLAAAAGWLVNERVALLISQVLLALVTLAVAAIGVLVSPILFVLLSGFELLRRMNAENVPQETPAPATVEMFEQFQDLSAQNSDLIQNLWNSSRGLLLAALLIIVVILILRRLDWRPWQRQAVLEEEESSDIRNIPRLRPRSAPGAIRASRLSWRRGRQLLAAAHIRRIYTDLLELCNRLGKPRPIAKTPLEFLPELRSLFPGQPDELELITAAYLKVRYGQLPETQEEVRKVLAAWEKVKSSAKGLIPSRR